MTDDYPDAFARKLVHHCTPALAAIKPANLFTCPLPDRAAELSGEQADRDRERRFRRALSRARDKLAPRGVRIEVLARRRTGALLYVYRPDLVMQAVTTDPAAEFLRSEGYDTTSLSLCIEHLHRRICGTDLNSAASGSCEFPHEIGLFLGYPFDDVMGFIRNGGENFLCCGCWKVYSRQRDAQDCFCRYKACTAAYDALYAQGIGIEQLAAVGATELALVG